MATAQNTTYYKKLKPLMVTARFVGLTYNYSSEKTSRRVRCEKVYSATVVTYISLNSLRLLAAFDLTPRPVFEIITNVLFYLWSFELMMNAILIHVKTPKLFQFFVDLERHVDNINHLTENEHVRLKHLKILHIISISAVFILIMYSSAYAWGVAELIYDPIRMFAMIPPIKPGSIPNTTAIVIFLTINAAATIYIIPNYFLTNVLFCCICYIIWREFVYFNTKLQLVSSSGVHFSLEDYRMYHNGICKLVDKVDDVFSFYIANMFGCTIILLCLSLYSIIHGEASVDVLAAGYSYLVYNGVVLSTVALCSAKVNKEVSSYITFGYKLVFKSHATSECDSSDQAVSVGVVGVNIF